MGRSTDVVLVLALLCFSAYTVVASDCVYTFFIKTGSRISGGTNSVISATLFDENGGSVQISNIEEWGGLMGEDHDYFERGDLDIFSGRAACTSTRTICALNLTSDGTGSHPGWYVSYADVTMAGARSECSTQNFDIGQWIADDAYPYELYAFSSNCASSNGYGHHARKYRHAFLTTE